MYAPINQIQSPDDEDEDHQEPTSFLNYYNHSFPCFNGAPTAPSNPSAPRKRKSEGGDGEGRVVRPAGRKDRHSKVRTARGPRDRRVRLSPTTAIQFYDVQDRLGYDRPSKAIDWLIKEAKAAIDALGCEQASENHGNASGGFSGEAAAAAAVCLDRDYEVGFFPGLNPDYSCCSSVQSNMFREPLQSSNYDFGGFHFSSELSKIAASATPKQDENLKKLIFSNYQD
ncbi:hypothetical protein AAHA92_02892 [Salvia divinorum]|uniref:TCP domain-containing protein n=1 Tax=Salvia divinorum TaxID=28513 RepID=A0ABD1IFC1_SALDI